ncbi:carbohydrate ABC transporter substrate-binding protein (CUT1 family) [Homoserinimonas aerilata]|uniref:Carbohydrate ABC transporter substrate-binding protein (CUT1 family) n=1 Tax=Homoserinimonas aerilata TaxID=1162970 RepID=A0A542XX90_9MICO|nr:sugar ABC transporter substrate-binding protein [Homoserinimonas aerilata]TQL40419.1 carbohydrate ABC transporter substrate-binding protein (CUT1 family) [Homoserinimonas aerilata]
MRKTAFAASLIALALVGSMAGCATSEPEAPKKLTMLIGSSGDMETNGIIAATKRWTDKSGIDVEVIAASDLTQQLGQGFAGGDPADIFYMSWDQFQTYASNGYLEPYAEDLPNAADFYPSLVDTFSHDGTFYCAPKDFGTLALVINEDKWAEAGLTEADTPTTWDELEDVATKLTTADTVGFSFGLEYARVGTFMNQAGGKLFDGDTATATSPENLEGLEYIQHLYDAGVYRTPSELDAGWAGEAFGAGKAAMVIEGAWVSGVKLDYPELSYRAVNLPAGPAGVSTFAFTNCWGIPADSATLEQTKDLVAFLTSEEQLKIAAGEVGQIPPVTTLGDWFNGEYPQNAAFAAGDIATNPINFDGSAAVVTDFNAELSTLFTGNAQSILEKFQKNLQPALDASTR